MGRPKKNKEVIKSRPEKGRLEGPSRFDIGQETKNSIWGILSFILAVVSVLSFIGRAGQGGALFDSFARSLFGWGFFIIPVALVLLGVAFIKSISRKIYFSAVFGTILFTLATLAIFFIFGEGSFNVRVTQGGYLGIILGLPLLKSVGFVASAIILVALILISVLVSLDVSITGLFYKNEVDEEVDEVSSSFFMDFNLDKFKPNTLSKSIANANFSSSFKSDFKTSCNTAMAIGVFRSSFIARKNLSLYRSKFTHLSSSNSKLFSNIPFDSFSPAGTQLNSLI